jgi:hypothetical protein
LAEGWAITGAPPVVETAWGRGMDFDGTNDFISCTSTDNMIDFTGDFSFEAVINPELIAGGAKYILMQGVFNASGIIFALTAGGAIDFYTSQGGAFQNTRSNNVVVIDTLQHLLITRSGNDATLYRNGVELAQALTGVHVNPVASANPYRIGVEAGGGSRFNGIIESVRAYGRELSQADVSYIYNSYIGAL